MAERDLIKAIRKRYAEMGRAKRIKTIQGLSVDGLSFIQKFLPEYYAEASPSLREWVPNAGNQMRPMRYSQSLIRL